MALEQEVGRGPDATGAERHVRRLDRLRAAWEPSEIVATRSHSVRPVLGRSPRKEGWGGDRCVERGPGQGTTQGGCSGAGP